MHQSELYSLMQSALQKRDSLGPYVVVINIDIRQRYCRLLGQCDLVCNDQPVSMHTVPSMTSTFAEAALENGCSLALFFHVMRVLSNLF